MNSSQLFQGSRGRIVAALRREMMTAEELATSLGQTKHAVRAQLRSMERNGVVETAGVRPGVTRPFAIYRLTVPVEQLLSRAYAPFLTRLVDVFASRHPVKQFETIMRDTGRALAHDLGGPVRARSSLRERIGAAAQLLNDQLGAVTQLEEDDSGVTITGAACPLAALTWTNRGACLAIESLLSECVGVRVRESCDRRERPRCRFRVSVRRVRRPARSG